MVSQAAHVVFVLLVCAFLAAVCAWGYRRSRGWGVVIAVGAIVRLASGLLLFSISKYHWPIFESLQTGDGFWAVAPDARGYYALAANAGGGYLPSIVAGSPSPTYVYALSLWFRACGTSIPSAVIFNLACYMVAAT